MPPIYTHDFQFQINGVDVEGEVVFNHGQEPTINTTAGEQVTIKKHGKIQEIFEFFTKVTKEIGEIQKIEVIKKP